MNALAQALDLLDRGDWQAAHVIVQEESSALAAWLHGIVHTLEGDLDNAQYWYRRAERPFPGASAVRTSSARRDARSGDGGTRLAFPPSAGSKPAGQEDALGEAGR